MRFKEFKNIITEGTKGRQADIPSFDEPGYFTVGDSHSNGISDYGRGKTWKALGMDGASAFDSMHLAAIEKIPAGSVVAISLGANDLGKRNEKGTAIPQIVSQVKKIVDAADAKSLQVIYLLPTSTAPNKPQDPKRNELRQALQSAINTTIVDLGEASPNDTMGVHLSPAGYSSIARQISGQYKPKGIGINIGNPNQEPGSPSTKDRIKNDTNLVQGPPYPLEKQEEVKKIQTSLQELGYNVGRTGIDGKYGPFTAAAVAAFKKDYNVEGNGSKFDKQSYDTLAKLQAGQIARVKEPTRSNTTQGAELNIAAMTSVENIDRARNIADDFLGRTLNEDEWKHLIQTTTAESSPNQQEMAQIAAVILNRTRVKYGGKSTVVDIVYAPGQFQPVTGEYNRKTKQWSGPNRNFLTPVNQTRLAQIIDAYIKYLPTADKTFMNFTSANPNAYSGPEGRKFLNKMIASGGEKIGGTIFGTIT